MAERPTLLEVLTKRLGGIESVPRSSAFGRLLTSHGVPLTPDFRRIETLPRRDWQTDATLKEATRELTDWLRLPGGDSPCSSACACPRELWPNQAAALVEAGTINGGFGPHGVGKGKALISILVATVFDAERPVLFVPAQLRDQTNRKVLPMLSKHWRVNPRLRVFGYSELSLAKNKGMLFNLAPDLIVLDEAHACKNGQAARTKRLREYLKAEPTTRVVALSGTITRRSIRDYWQLLLWSLKPDLCPLPSTWREMVDWSNALDEGVMDQERMAPGALLRLAKDSDFEGPSILSDRNAARAGYRRRLVETPGVVATSEDELGVSLLIREHRVSTPLIIVDHMKHMRETWETPYGDEITEAVELWRHARELACGFFYRWKDPPPPGWLGARKEWKRAVRDILKGNRRGLDSELLVARDVARQADAGVKSPDVAAWRAWSEVKDSFEPETVAEWLSTFAIDAAVAWLRSEEAGVAWTEHVAFGEKLAEAADVPYFGAGMKASAWILDHRGPCVASIAAHSTGKNLQHWSRALVTAPPSSGKTWEQALGRLHRQGQEDDEVVYDVFLHGDELRSSLRQALADARYIEATTGARQKLLYASIVAEGI